MYGNPAATNGVILPLPMTKRTTVALVCLSFFASVGCQRTVHITEPMTWECAPDEYKPAFAARPDEYVRFRFVNDPRWFEVESSKDFCADMQKAARPVVNVEFELWGRSHTLRGYRVIAVDGRPLENVGGWGNSGANDPSGPSPLNHAFAR